MLIHGGDGFWRKQRRRIRTSRQLKPALDVSLGLIRIQRHEVRAQGNSLLQLPQADGIEFFIQFRLSDQKNLQQLLLRSFEIAQEPDFFQNFRRKVMGFVDHQSCCQFLLAARNHIVRNLQQQFAFILAGGGSPRSLAKYCRNSTGDSRPLKM